jgi:hypothetical protein
MSLRRRLRTCEVALRIRFGPQAGCEPIRSSSSGFSGKVPPALQAKQGESGCWFGTSAVMGGGKRRRPAIAPRDAGSKSAAGMQSDRLGAARSTPTIRMRGAVSRSAIETTCLETSCLGFGARWAAAHLLAEAHYGHLCAACCKRPRDIVDMVGKDDHGMQCFDLPLFEGKKRRHLSVRHLWRWETNGNRRPPSAEFMRRLPQLLAAAKLGVENERSRASPAQARTLHRAGGKGRSSSGRTSLSLPKSWLARSVILIGKIPWFWSYGAVRIAAAGAALQIRFGREP